MVEWTCSTKESVPIRCCAEPIVRWKFVAADETAVFFVTEIFPVDFERQSLADELAPMLFARATRHSFPG